MSETFDAYREWLGIEPDEHPVDHYRLLGLPRFESDAAVIASAAEARMSEIRRYQTGPRGKHTQDLLNRLSTAKLCLLNPSTKAIYDRAIAAPAEPAASDLPPPGVPLGNAFGSMAAPLPPAVPPPLPPPVPPPAVGVDVPTPPVPAPPVSGFAPALVRDDGQHEDETDELSFFARPLFPLLVIGAVTLIAASAWGIGRVLSERETLRESSIETAVEEPVAPEPVKPPPEPDDADVVIQQEGDGSFNFSPAVAQRHGPHVQLLTEGDVQVIGNWKSPDDWIEWRFHVVRPSIFRVLVTYRTASDGGDNSYTLDLDDGAVRRTFDVRKAAADGYVTDEHFLPIASGGKHTLAVRADSIAGEELMVLRSIRFVPRTNP